MKVLILVCMIFLLTLSFQIEKKALLNEVAISGNNLGFANQTG